MKINAVIMASGRSKRFGENKLLYEFDGKPLIESTFCAVKKSSIAKTVVVTGYDEIVRLAEKYGFEAVLNDDKTDDLSVTIRLGVNEARDGEGIMLCVGDQPFLTAETVDSLIRLFEENPESICAVSHRGESGNPVIFPKATFDELAGLPPFGRGKDVISNRKGILKLLELPNGKELFDVDEKSDVVEYSEN